MTIARPLLYRHVTGLFIFFFVFHYSVLVFCFPYVYAIRSGARESDVGLVKKNMENEHFCQYTSDLRRRQRESIIKGGVNFDRRKRSDDEYLCMKCSSTLSLQSSRNLKKCLCVQ